MQTGGQRIASYGFILNSKRQLLIVQRAEHDSYPGIWELPGGASELGEDPKDAAKREVNEETGLMVDIGYPLGVLSAHPRRHPQRQDIRIAFLCTLNNDQQTVMLSDEHSNFRWAGLDEPIPSQSEFLQYILNEVQRYPALLP